MVAYRKQDLKGSMALIQSAGKFKIWQHFLEKL